jgi:hypothetical protein
MNNIQTQALRDHLQAFDFTALFIDDLGWTYGQPLSFSLHAGGQNWAGQEIAAMAGVVAFLIDGLPEHAVRLAIHTELTQRTHENVVIFVDSMLNPTRSLWLWLRRDGKKQLPREHVYMKGQPGDLFLSKLSAMVVDINELDENGQFPLVELVKRLTAALDIERVTKKFFAQYDAQRKSFIALIVGIENEKERQWLASILLNRLMFIWFLQRKGFLDNGNTNYLVDKLTDSQERRADSFYAEFLQALFFAGFAQPELERSAAAQALIGVIPFLNGGLFLPHRLETHYQATVQIPDCAFAAVFKLFASYSWHLDDTPGGQDDEINPDVLGYIFEKYVNQKAFGAYYTRPEITNYLCERTIHGLILARLNTEHSFDLPLAAGRKFQSFNELLLNLDVGLCRELWELLPQLKLLDPACGSGAFLVAALKTLVNIYAPLLEKIVALNDAGLLKQVRQWQAQHKSLNYFIKRRIISDNLFGVEIHEEATEIAKLRLFLALVASAHTIEELEPLPNIDFNLLAGNSLIGLMRVDPLEFDQQNKQGDLFFNGTYQKLVAEKNRLIQLYRDTVAYSGTVNLATLKAEIEAHKAVAQPVLNQLLLHEMNGAGVRFEAAVWDEQKGKLGKPKKRQLTAADITALRPFHWGFEFHEVLHQRGGFDAIITNPPWEVFQTDEKEFFQEFDASIQKNKLRLEDWKKQFSSFMREPETRKAWLDYASRFPFVTKWFKSAPQYVNQTSGKINLYLLFVEQSYNLLRSGGECGIVIPSGIYTDLGAKGLRDLLFAHNQITGLFCFENKNEIFEGVHRSFKFVVLTFAKGGATTQFPASFMRHDVAELSTFPTQTGLSLSVDLIRRLSPESHSVMEFKSALDIEIAEKLLKFPMLGEKIEGAWNLRLASEFNMTTDHHLFKTEPGAGRLPLYEGKHFYHFTDDYGKPKYWLDENIARSELMAARVKQTTKLFLDSKLGIEIDPEMLRLDYQSYRLAFRDVASSTNERTFIGTILPPHRFCPHTVSLEKVFYDAIRQDKPVYNCVDLSQKERIFLLAVLNSFAVDYLFRQRVTSHVSFFFVYNIPVPRLTETDAAFAPIVSRAARLICTTPEFDDLAKEVGLESHTGGVTNSAERAQLRAELDGLIAHLYGLTETEFAHILSTFPLIADEIKTAALKAYLAKKYQTL